MADPIILFCLVIVIDILFIVNFLYTWGHKQKALRKKKEEQSDTEDSSDGSETRIAVRKEVKPKVAREDNNKSKAGNDGVKSDNGNVDEGEGNEEEEEDTGIVATILRSIGRTSDTTKVREVANVSQASDESDGQDEEEVVEEVVKKPYQMPFGSHVSHSVYALICDTTYRCDNDVVRFDWKTKWQSITSTVILVVFSSLILSPQLVLKTNSPNMLVRSTSVDFCKTDVETTLWRLQHDLDAATNRIQAREQSQRLEEFHTALVHDVSRYGEGSYVCDDIGNVPGDKQEYNSKDLDKVNGPFFPGYCQAALDESIKLAKEQQCEKLVCASVEKFGVTWAEECVQVYSTCPRQTDDEEAALDDYHSTQLEINNDRVEEDGGVRFGNRFADAAAETLQEQASVLITKVLHQVDVAGFLYTFYALSTVMFPAPILLFRSSRGVAINRFLFGANKYQFIILVLLVWWGIEFADFVLRSPNLRALAFTILNEPCYADNDFVTKRYDLVHQACDEMLNYTNTFRTYNVALDHLIRQAEVFVNSDECCGDSSGFPYIEMRNMESYPGSQVEQVMNLGFTRELTWLPTSDAAVYGPRTNLTFVGNISVCINPNAAQNMVFDTDLDAEVTWWELWITTGLIASFFIKVLVTNLGVALYWMADPLARCGGKYEFPPRLLEHVTKEEKTQIQSLAETGLQVLSVKWSIIWFFLVKVCLLNLMVASEYTRDGWDLSDPVYRLATSVLGIGFAIVLAFLHLNYRSFCRRERLPPYAAATGIPPPPPTAPHASPRPASYFQRTSVVEPLPEAEVIEIQRIASDA